MMTCCQNDVEGMIYDNLISWYSDIMIMMVMMMIHSCRCCDHKCDDVDVDDDSNLHTSLCSTSLSQRFADIWDIALHTTILMITMIVMMIMMIMINKENNHDHRHIDIHQNLKVSLHQYWLCISFCMDNMDFSLWLSSAAYSYLSDLNPLTIL